MPRKMGTRTVGLDRRLYERLRSHCEATGEPISWLIARNLTAMLDHYNVPQPEVPSTVRRAHGGIMVF